MSLANTQTNDLMPPVARALAPYLILALAVFAAYSNIFDNVFLFDDDLIIKANTYLRGWSHIGDILKGSTTSGVHIVGGFYRPLQILLYLLAFHLGDGCSCINTALGNPADFAACTLMGVTACAFWFHALNLGLHIANTCFVYRLGAKLGFDAKGVFLAALIWGLHALHTEAVTYISSTADTLHTFFCLLGVVVLLPDITPRKILAVIPLFLLGIASKETTVMFPLLVMVCLFYTNPQRFSPRTYLRTWPLWLISLCYVAWRSNAEGFDGPRTYARFYTMPAFSSLKTYSEQPLYRLYTFLSTLPQYAKLLAWPTHLHMERSFTIQQSPWSWLVATGFLMTVLALSHIAYSYKIKRWTELTRFAEPGHGHVHIDSNAVERSIRPSAVGKKNFLFIGHPDAGWRSAVIYSVLGTCTLQGVNPWSYLTWALPRLAAATNHTAGEFTPQRFAVIGT